MRAVSQFILIKAEWSYNQFIKSKDCKAVLSLSMLTHFGEKQIKIEQECRMKASLSTDNYYFTRSISSLNSTPG